ncbi:LacI family DNA-binding transcriptional regulator [Microbacterium sp. LWH11-1.2]|uniref:LacI family DNA-binding transcriptional regulator n=1 Tax=Microbacterium sp. LWH11-1.2 TaxID=3135258 RepID=UPI0031391EBF
MSSSPTMADVARLAGVSKKTVSNYFNGYRYLRDETKTRIADAVQQLNYKVNISARNLSSGRTGAIGLAIPELAHPYFSEFAQAVVAAAQRRSVNVLVEVTGGDREHELDVLSGGNGRAVDGIIFGPLALGADDIAAATVDVPIVLIGDRADSRRFDFVTVDNERGAYDATSHLIASGRRRIVGLGGEESEAPAAASLRSQGFRAALREHGISMDADLLTGPIPWTRASGAAAVQGLLDAGVEFDAVFGLNDALALGALSALLTRGIAVPAEVAVIGFDNVEEAQFASPALTTVDSGLNWVAERAVELLLSRISGEISGPTSEIADHRVVVRATA